MAGKSLTISVVAKTAGVGVETVRYYQRIGLINEPEKPDAGYRIYPEQTIFRLRFIKRAKELGFSLAEISNLLELGDGHCLETKQLASHKLALIKSKINDLKAMEQTLEKLVQCCEKTPAHKGCPIIAAIAQE